MGYARIDDSNTAVEFSCDLKFNGSSGVDVIYHDAISSSPSHPDYDPDYYTTLQARYDELRTAYEIAAKLHVNNATMSFYLGGPYSGQQPIATFTHKIRSYYELIFQDTNNLDDIPGELKNHVRYTYQYAPYLDLRQGFSFVDSVQGDWTTYCVVDVKRYNSVVSGPYTRTYDFEYTFTYDCDITSNCLLQTTDLYVWISRHYLDTGAGYPSRLNGLILDYKWANYNEGSSLEVFVEMTSTGAYGYGPSSQTINNTITRTYDSVDGQLGWFAPNFYSGAFKSIGNLASVENIVYSEHTPNYDAFDHTLSPSAYHPLSGITTQLYGISNGVYLDLLSSTKSASISVPGGSSIVNAITYYVPRKYTPVILENDLHVYDFNDELSNVEIILPELTDGISYIQPEEKRRLVTSPHTSTDVYWGQGGDSYLSFGVPGYSNILPPTSIGRGAQTYKLNDGPITGTALIDDPWENNWIQDNSESEGDVEFIFEHPTLNGSWYTGLKVRHKTKESIQQPEHYIAAGYSGLPSTWTTVGSNISVEQSATTPKTTIITVSSGADNSSGITRTFNDSYFDYWSDNTRSDFTIDDLRHLKSSGIYDTTNWDNYKFLLFLFNVLDTLPNSLTVTVTITYWDVTDYTVGDTYPNNIEKTEETATYTISFDTSTGDKTKILDMLGTSGGDLKLMHVKSLALTGFQHTGGPDYQIELKDIELALRNPNTDTNYSGQVKMKHMQSNLGSEAVSTTFVTDGVACCRIPRLFNPTVDVTRPGIFCREALLSGLLDMRTPAEILNIQQGFEVDVSAGNFEYGDTSYDSAFVDSSGNSVFDDTPFSSISSFVASKLNWIDILQTIGEDITQSDDTYGSWPAALACGTINLISGYPIPVNVHKVIHGGTRGYVINGSGERQIGASIDIHEMVDDASNQLIETVVTDDWGSYWSVKGARETPGYSSADASRPNYGIKAVPNGDTPVDQIPVVNIFWSYPGGIILFSSNCEQTAAAFDAKTGLYHFCYTDTSSSLKMVKYIIYEKGTDGTLQIADSFTPSAVDVGLGQCPSLCIIPGNREVVFLNYANNLEFLYKSTDVQNFSSKTAVIADVTCASVIYDPLSYKFYAVGFRGDNLVFWKSNKVQEQLNISFSETDKSTVASITGDSIAAGRPPKIYIENDRSFKCIYVTTDGDIVTKSSRGGTSWS